MEIAPATDFDFSFPSHYATAPATDFDFSFPSHYATAPSSPTRLPELLIAADATSLAAIPFAWEEKPGVPKTPSTLLQQQDDDDDFSFNVTCHLDTEHSFTTVDPPPRVQERERGRERRVVSSSSSRSRRTRSLSPVGSSYQLRQQVAYSLSPVGSSDHLRQQVAYPSSPAVPETGSRRWSLLDILLFRSASDGRAMDRDPLKKYSANFRKHDQDIRNSGSVSNRRGRVSAHEVHYNVNRAVSNDMKKKTYLPYKQGILGRFSFNP